MLNATMQFNSNKLIAASCKLLYSKLNVNPLSLSEIQEAPR